VLPFGVVAPEALHRTTFEEHGCANARSIVQRETLYVENNICSIHYDTVLEGDRKGEGRNPLLLHEASRNQNLRQAFFSIASQWFGTRFLTEIQAEMKWVEITEGKLQITDCRLSFGDWNCRLQNEKCRM
jgi:hypothetical protein